MYTFASAFALLAVVAAHPAEDTAVSSVFSQYDYPGGRGYDSDYYGYPASYSMRRREAEAYRTSGPGYDDGRRSYRQGNREAYAYAKARGYGTAYTGSRGRAQGYIYDTPNEQIILDSDIASQVSDEVESNLGLYRRNFIPGYAEATVISDDTEAPYQG